MNFNNYTIKAQEPVQKASEIVTGHQQQAIEPAHLLKALLTVDEHLAPHLLKKLNVNVAHLSQEFSSVRKCHVVNDYFCYKTD